MDKPVIIFGAKGIALDALAIFESNNIVVYGFLDDDEKLHGTDIFNIPVLGATEDHGYTKLIGQKCESFVAVDAPSEREHLIEYLNERRKVMPTNAVHQTAFIDPNASIGHGNFINTKASIAPGVKIGNHCLIHSGAIIESGCKIDDFAQIGAGAIIGRDAHVGAGAFIGAGANVIAGVKIGEKSSVGAGSLVMKEVENSSTVFGNPAVKV